MQYRTSLITILLGLNFALPVLSAPVDGHQVAEQMTQRYMDTRDTCDSESAYQCNGLIIRAANASERYHAWEVSPTAQKRGGVPFSYFRVDLETDQFQHNRQNGFTLKDGKAMAEAPYPLAVLCSFPYDADTNHRNEKGCGEFQGLPGSEKCAAQNITTATAWIKHFEEFGLEMKRYQHQCSFDAGTDSFAVSLESRRLTNPHTQLEGWHQNELAISAWPDGIGEKLPIESFFYVEQPQDYDPTASPASPPLTGLAAAQFMQKDFFNQTKLVVPIVRMDFHNNGKPITWHADEQLSTDNFKLRALEATGDGGAELTWDDYYRLRALTIDVPAYAQMEKGQTVTVLWEGPFHIYQTSSQTVTDIAPMHFQIPRPEFIDAIGETAQMLFIVIDNAGQLTLSARTPLRVEGQTLSLPAPELSDDQRYLSVSYNDATTEQRISVTLTGKTNYRSPLKKPEVGKPTLFSVPQDWLDANKGHNVTMNYAVGDELGGKFQFSRELWTTIAPDVATDK